jgi:hypothetical protein
VDEEQATMDLLTVCISYLCYDTLGSELSDAEIKESISLGKFRLLDFAASYWVAVLVKCCELSPGKERVKSISGLLADLISKRTNYWFDEPAGPPDAVEKDTAVVKDDKKMLRQMEEFTANQRRDEWTLSNGNTVFNSFLDNSICN